MSSRKVREKQDSLPLTPRLDSALSEIRNIMKREGLRLCFLESDDKIHFIVGDQC
jgi:hypothetical protein